MINSSETEKTPVFSLEHNVPQQLGYFFPKESLPDHLQSASDAIGRVIGNGTFGTCFIVEGPKGQYLVSAKHCFYGRNEKIEEKRVILSSGRSIRYKLSSAVKPNEDVLVVKLSEELPIKPLKLSSEVNFSQTIALGLPYSYSEALGRLRQGMPVASIGEILERDYKLITSNVRVEAGNSGSPLLDLGGRVIGVVSERRSVLHESAAALASNYDLARSHRRLGTFCYAVPLHESYFK